MKKRNHTHKPPAEGLGKERLSAFSDGVFAIATTLLVLDINVPHIIGHDAARQLPLRLLALWPKFASYALSFVIISVYWVAHHLMLFALARTDRTLLWLNNLLLLFIVLIPFSASLLGNYPHHPVAAAIYGGNLVITSLTLQSWWTYATRGHRLIDRRLPNAYIRAGSKRTLSSAGIYLVATIVAFIKPSISVALYWLGPAYYVYLQSKGDKRLDQNVNDS